MSKLEKAHLELIVPFEEKIEELNRQLGGYTAREIIGALESRSGELYSLLAERGKIIKKNHAARTEIAKLSIVLARLPDGLRDSLKAAVRKGSITEPVLLNGCGSDVSGRMLRLLNRVGVPAVIVEGKLTGEGVTETEVMFRFDSENVWVSKEKQEQLSKNIERMEKISRRIQFKTAERQIRVFEGEEEDNFRNLQKEYLELLKERDSLLDDFRSEESMSFKVS